MAEGTPTPMQRATPGLSLHQESELVVVIFRAALILLAAIAPRIIGLQEVPRAAFQYALAAAVIYEVVLIMLWARRVSLRYQRHFMLAADILLVSSWVYLTWTSSPGATGSPLFPFFYVVIIIGALWFSARGALLTAVAITSLYVLMVININGFEPFTLIDILVREVIYLFLVATISGYVVDTYRREREQGTRSQVLLAQYQERFRAAEELYELLIPAQPPPIPQMQVAARWRPALQEGGGDFYDITPLPSGRIALTIADVSGKFTRSSLQLPLFKAAFLATVQLWEDPGEVLAQVNRIVYPYLQPDMFISACMLVYDPARGEIVYSSAGQDPPVFVHAETRETMTLETGGIPLGIDAHPRYPSERLRLSPGDTLCLYTDGITEARNAARDEFGVANLEARLLAGVAVGWSAEAMADNLFEAVQQFVQSAGHHDDMTLLVLRYHVE